MDWPLLASLDAEDRRRVLALARRTQVQAGRHARPEGDPSDSLHLVESGRLAVRVSTSDGDSATVNLLGPGDYFGELSLLDGQPPVRSATIVALETASTLSLSATDFRDLRRRHRAADQLLLTLMARRIEALSERLLEAMYDPLDRRLNKRLAELADSYAAPDAENGSPVTIPLTQEQLAELVGGSRPSVNQALQKLTSLGVTELARGRVIVVDRDWLARNST